MGDWNSLMWMHDLNYKPTGLAAKLSGLIGKTKKWKEMHVPFKRKWYSACASPDGVVFTGGITLEDQRESRDCYEFNVTDNKWASLRLDDFGIHQFT